MRCRKAQKWLSARFDGELDPARIRPVTDHVAGCAFCERFVGNLPHCSAAMDLTTLREPLAGFTAAAMARLPEGQARRFWFTNWLEALRPAPATAAGVALCCGVLLALSMNGGQRSGAGDGAEPVDALYAESFDALSGDSVAARYLAMIEEGDN